MIVSNLNKVAIATTLPMCSLRHGQSRRPFINIRRPKWKGTAAILKNIPIVTSIIPMETIGSSADCDNSLISITSKLPIAPYIKQIPKYNSTQKSHQEIL
jgi:hypothetical protein